MNNLLVQFAIQMTLPYKIPHCIIIVITDIIKDSNIKLRKTQWPECKFLLF